MPSSAIATAETALDERLPGDRFAAPTTTSSRPIFATSLLLRIARLAGAANEDRADPRAPRQPTRRSPPNHCEFDYDYYVALQSRRRHQPSRLNRCPAPGAEV